MKKLLNALPLLMLLAGCELYFGGDNSSGNGSWSYCGTDGYYQCDSNNNCTLVSATCPPDSSDGGSGGSVGGSGFECDSNADCSAGCYCTSSGVCEEGGFCTSDSDCGSGYFCDTSRSSCEPDGSGSGSGSGVTTCSSNTDCTGSEQYCDATTGTCQTGSCAGTVTCNLGPPTCPSGEAPVIGNGCYTGTCQAIASCDAAPACGNINDEQDCLNRANDCTAVYTGIDCTNSSGQSCTSGDAGCTCQSFSFDHCSAN
ncbi:MAG TPA: hypothetical protein VGL61_07980 [Kofleriaceae bacterium]|jgi:hypothetical protein